MFSSEPAMEIEKEVSKTIEIAISFRNISTPLILNTLELLLFSASTIQF
jgi:hypothetical protein